MTHEPQEAGMAMTELEKLDAGLEYCFDDPEVAIHVGENFLANYNVTILDIAPVRIGEHCMIGPGAVISTVGHPLTAAGRRAHLGLGRPVTLGDDVWIGANCTILPGVTIGSDVVIAAGAVVTKGVPDHCVVGGVPATVLKHLDPAE